MLQSQGWSSGSRQPDVRGRRSVRNRAMVGRTDARAEKPNVSTTSRAEGLHTETGREESAPVRSADGRFIMHLPQCVFGMRCGFCLSCVPIPVVFVRLFRQA